MSHESQNLEPTAVTNTEKDQLIADEKPTYRDKTDRIRAWSELIKFLSPYIWTAVILIVIIPLLGRGFIVGSFAGKTSSSADRNNPVTIIDRTIPNPNEIDQAILAAIKSAHTDAESFASEKLDAWVDQLMTRVDDSFLDWYFNYFNQKKLEFSTPFIWLSSTVTHWIDTHNPPPQQIVAEKITEDFQVEFAKRVLRPKIAQLELERITRDTSNLYVTELGNQISSIQSSYKIPQGEWERYLDDIAITIRDTEGNISNLSVKLLIGGSSYLLVKAMLPITAKVGSKVAATLAGKSAAKMAAKTGGTVAAKIGAEFLDPIVAVGILIWDVWDYHHTVAVERPILREAILKYLQEVKASLLDNPENGVMAAIYELESSIVKSVQSAVPPV